MKKIGTLLAVLAVVGSAFVSTVGAANAAPAAGVAAIACQAELPEWPSDLNSGECNNIAAVGVGTHTTVTPADVITSINAEFTYSEPCLANEPPLTGEASGTAHLGTLSGDVYDVDFDWLRVGLVAVVTHTTGPDAGGHSHAGATAGVAAFAPVPPLGTCAPNGADKLTAEVVGLAGTAGN